MPTARRRAPMHLSLRDGVMVLIGAVTAVMLTGFILLTDTTRPALPYRSPGVTISWLPETVSRWNKITDQMAERYNLDPDLLAMIIAVESGGDPNAKSEAQAVGLTQVTPLTAKDIASKYLKQPVQKYDLTNPTTSIEFGAAYLAWLRDQFGTADPARSAELIAAGYNGGPSAAQALIDGEGLRDMQTVSYSRDVYNMYQERHAKTSPTFDRWKDRGGNDLIAAAAKVQP